MRNSLVATFVVALVGAAVPVFGQGDGQFLCSSGARDGQTCLAFSDCPDGVCVIAQGVCPDGFLCDCPGGGTCVETPECNLDANFGTCAGGVSDTLCCDTAFNCNPGDSCVGTQKVCADGTDKGLPCIDDDQCTDSACISNCSYCDGGTFDFFPCVDDADCPGGACDASFCATEPTPVTPQSTSTPTRTRTPVTPGSTPPPTNTPPTPINPTPPDITPQNTPTFPPNVDTPTPVPPTATFTPVIGEAATTIGTAPAGDNQLELAIDPRTFPVQGVVEVLGEQISFTRRRSSRILNLQAELGLPFEVASGTIVRVIEITPTPGPFSDEETKTDEGGGCAVVRGESAASSGGIWLILIGGVLLRLRRRG